MTGRQHDRFADIYRVWADSVPVTRENLRFYVEECMAAEGPVAELGVGDGRIAVEVARSRSIIGVDSSPVMLELCRANAERAGVADRLTLIEADMREFELSQPAGLVTIPFHAIGHLLSLDEKRACLERVRRQLAPGGRLVFDHFVFDSDYADSRDGVPVLRAEYEAPDSGRDAVLWEVTRYDYGRQTMRILVWSDELDGEGVVVRRRYRPLDFSWIEPAQTRQLLEESGFEVEALYGDFERRPFDGASRRQVWAARRAG